MAERPRGIEIGTVLAERYRIERVLASGGMGVVVLATQLVTERPVAIKFMRAGPGPAAELDIAGKRFAREAKAAAMLRSEHVVRILDVAALESGEPYMVMEHLEGGDLETVARDREPLPVSVVVDWALQALEALAEAHACGIVHRDIKPRNLFLTHRPDGSPLVKILDFGVSKLTRGQVEVLTSTDAIIGSPGYMAPEQLRDSSDVDGRTDIFSLGATIYRLLEGRNPFESERVATTIQRVLFEAPAPFTRSDVPARLEAAVRRCLEKQAEDRFPDVRALAEALAKSANGGSTGQVERIGRVLAGGAGVEPPNAASTPASHGGTIDLEAPPFASTVARSDPDRTWAAVARSTVRRMPRWATAAMVGMSALTTGAVLYLFGGRHEVGPPPAIVGLASSPPLTPSASADLVPVSLSSSTPGAPPNPLPSRAVGPAAPRRPSRPPSRRPSLAPPPASAASSAPPPGPVPTFGGRN